LSKIQEEQGQAVIDLHKKLAKHVKDMHVWKDFLEQDKEYDSVDIHITMGEDIAHDTFDTKVDICTEAFNGITFFHFSFFHFFIFSLFHFSLFQSLLLILHFILIFFRGNYYSFKIITRKKWWKVRCTRRCHLIFLTAYKKTS
jgi:hypothetical protein